MDVQGILSAGDSALPQLSTGTMTAQNNGSFSVPITQSGLVKFGVSGILSVLGMYYLAVGKKESDLQKMLLGAAISLVALFLF